MAKKPLTESEQLAQSGVPKGDRFWIEIERHDDPDVCKRRAMRLSAILQSMGFAPDLIWYNTRRCVYCQSHGPVYTELSDRGLWINFNQMDGLQKALKEGQK